MRADTALNSAQKYSRIFDIRSVFWAKSALSRPHLGHFQRDRNSDAGRNICRIFAVSFDTIAAVPGNRRDCDESLNLDGA